MIIQKMFSDKNYCFAELLNARKIFCKKPYTQKEHEEISKVLSLMYLYCHEELKELVLATIEEAEQRYFYELTTLLTEESI